MLVGSCTPTTAPIQFVLVRCTRPGCAHVVTAVFERVALAALDEHYRWAYGQDGPHGHQ